MSKISQESIDKVKQIAIVDVAAALGLFMKRSGKQYFIPCPNPQHVETSHDHCAIETRKNIFHCFHCNCGGKDAIGFFKWFKFGTREGHFKESILGLGQLMGLEIKDEKGNVMVTGDNSYTPSVKISQNELKAQDAPITHAVYTAMLSLCQLKTQHLDELMNKRRYSKDEIKLHHFASVPNAEEWIRIYSILKSKNYPLDRIPGLSQIFQPANQPTKFPREIGEPGEFTDEKGVVTYGHWFYVHNASQGYFIPVYDENGYIIRLRVRKDSGEPKYVWFSSDHNVDSETQMRYARRNGASSGGPFTLAVPPQTLFNWQRGKNVTEVISTHTLLVTEGEHKANISAKAFNIPVAGLAGAGNFESLLPFIQKWGVKKLVIGYDMDTLQKQDDSLKSAKKLATLFEIVRNFAIEVTKLGVETVIWTWNLADGKGLDDLVLNGKLPVEFNLKTGVQRAVTLNSVHSL